MDIKGRLIEGNNRFIDEVNGNPHLRELTSMLVEGQKPYAIVISCSDSRVIPEMIFSTDPGELFIIRTAGNLINEGEIASIEYGIAHLGIKYILVLGHTRCGAIHASIEDEGGEYISCLTERIKKNIHGIHDEYLASKENAKAEARFILEKFPSYDGIIEPAIYHIDTTKVEFIDIGQ